MGAFSADRMEQMLKTYGDKDVAVARADAEKTLEQLSVFNEQLARHRGECRAYLEHDAHFLWERRLTNNFDELKRFVLADDPPQYTTDGVYNWKTLRAVAATRAVNLLARMEYPPSPWLMPAAQHDLWWQLVAIVHECDARCGK